MKASKNPYTSISEKMNRTLVCSCLASIAMSVTVRAQAPDTATLSTVIVSATKTPSSPSSLTQAVTVISGAELRARGITRVADALRGVPGMALVQNGSVGSITSLFMRGGESRYTRVLIDGVTVNSPGGYFDFSHLTTDNIERIEVVRGPAGVVYGADAVSGIVQIFTRQGRGPASMSGSARAGNYGSREGTLDAGGNSGRMRFSLGGGARRTDGILPFNNNYYNGTLSGSVGVAPRAGTDALVSARYTAAEFHYPTDFTGAPVDSNSYRVQHRLTVGMNGTSKLSETATGRLSFGTNEVSDLSEDIVQPFGTPGNLPPRRNAALLSRNKRRSAEAGVAFEFPESSVLTVGAEYVKESENSQNNEGALGGPTSLVSSFGAARTTRSVFTELVAGAPGGIAWTLAARRDDNSDYDAFTTYRAGASLPLDATSRLRASFSTAFNAPAFSQLRPTLYTSGSPDLRPERSRSWEVGVEQTALDGAVTVTANYFRQRFSDLIQYVSGGPPNYLGSFANLTEAESNGYEVEVQTTPVNGLSASASYTMVTPRATKISPEYAGDLKVGDALLRRPTHSGTGSIAWSRPNSGSLAVTGTYVGERPDLDFTQFPSPTISLPAYTRFDVSGSREVLRSATGKPVLALTFRVDNVLDRKYEDVLHFSAPGRTYLIGARVGGAM